MAAKLTRDTLERFGLARDPFLGDDSRLYLPEIHESALRTTARVAAAEAGIALVCGARGSGKSAFARHFARAVAAPPRAATVVLVEGAASGRSADRFLASIATELGVERSRDAYRLRRAVEDRARTLLAERRRVVLVVDDADRLACELLDALVSLWNMVTPDARRFLVRIVLVADPRVRTRLARDRHRALASRIALGSERLGPLTLAQTAALLGRRVALSGGAPALFSPSAVRVLHDASGRLPGPLLELASRALAVAARSGELAVDTGVAMRAAGAASLVA